MKLSQGLQCNLSAKENTCFITGNDDSEPILVNNTYEGGLTIPAIDGFFECRWNFSPPDGRTDLSLTLNVTNTDCKNMFKINGRPKCNETLPMIYRFYPTSCGQSCSNNNNCNDYEEYPLQITFDGTPDNKEFSLKYTFAPCFTTTKQTTEAAETPEPRTIKDIKIENAPAIIIVSGTKISRYTSGTRSSSPKTTISNILDTTVSPVIRPLSIFIPISVILLIGTVFIIVILKIRKQNEKRKNQQRVVHISDVHTYANVLHNIPEVMSTPGLYESSLSPIAPDPEYITEPEAVPTEGPATDKHAYAGIDMRPSASEEYASIEHQENRYLQPIRRDFIDGEYGYQTPIPLRPEDDTSYMRFQKK
uniref:uncharacterized protein LOC120342240 n=1 Tax=Styela clava TaxID=7725 RepID=UPI00193A374B|nr:uncharacterized protein LOC120342240 [Styela clava]